jgi:hypothetical protein
LIIDNTGKFYQVDNSAIIAGPMTRPGFIGANSDPADFGYYPFWIDTPAQPGTYYSLATGEPTVDEPNKRVVRTDSWTAWPEDQVRDTKEQEILEQIPQYTVAQEINDPSGVQANVIKATAAAQEKIRELNASTDPAAVDTKITWDHTPDPTLLASGDGWSVGSIQMSIMATPPGPLWRLADGSDCTGTAYATATGNNTLPDLRGAYLRMAGQNASNSAWNGGTLGGWQEDRTALPNTAFTTHSDGNHYHSLGWYEQEGGDMLQQYYNNTASAPSALAQHMRKMEDPASGGNTAEGSEREMATSTDGSHTHTIAGGDDETRPKTYCVNYFIKVD